MKKNKAFLSLKPLWLFLCLFVLSLTTIQAQDKRSVSGIIVDTEGEPLIGVSVVQKGTTNGTITDVDGSFQVNVPIGTPLLISYIGYESKELKATEKRMEVQLSLSQFMMDEVVVVGYGVQKKSVVTAAISKVTAEQLNASKPTRIEDALKGKVSGVQITQSSGQPGADSKVRIRGIGTINNSDPLYIVDGMPVDGGISYLNPTDIASVEILKDAASGAIYGARAANGVILVTTKSGKEGKATINYNFNYGWQNPWKKKAVLNATEYMTIMNEGKVNDGNAPRFSKSQIANAGKGTDWQDETFNYDAPVKSHQVSVQGGSQKMSYFLSMGYFGQDGIIGGNYGKSNFNRWTIRSNTSYDVYEAKDRKFLNKIRVGLNASYSRSKTSGIDVNSEYGSILGSALAFDPTIPVYASESQSLDILAKYPTVITDKNGKVFSLPPDGYQELANPRAMLNQPRHEKRKEDKLVGSLWAEIDIYSGLKFKTSYGYDMTIWDDNGYEYPYYQSSMTEVRESSVWSKMNRGYRWQVENVLTYDKTIANVHSFGIVLGQSASKYNLRNLEGTHYALIEQGKNTINSSTADMERSRIKGGTGSYNFNALASYFGRLNYNYDERYMAQLTVRKDGSSNFGPNNKWAVFPALSMGWNLHNEPYLQNIKPDWFDVLKLRFSWGRNGNESIGPFKYASLMNGNRNYYFGYDKDTPKGSMQYGVVPGYIANPNIKWEESEQIDIGIDTRFLNGALGFSFDYFKKDTNGMLKTIPTADYVGQGSATGNVGDMQNWGLEFEVEWKNRIGEVNYSISANATFMKNKLIDLGIPNGSEYLESNSAAGLGAFIKAENGQVWPYFYGFKTDGIFQNQAEVDAYVNKNGGKLQPLAKPGDVRFQDLDGDGLVTTEDKTKIGKGMPDWTVGFTLGADWRGFDVNLFFQGTIGNDIFDFSQRGDIPAMNRPSWILDRWMGEGTSNKIPRMTEANANGNWKASDLYIKDGSYLRLKTAQIGYTFPKAWMSKVSIANLRLYLMAENLLTLTKYDGFDPEIGAGDNYYTIGVDRGIYPQSRTVFLGANITF